MAKRKSSKSRSVVETERFAVEISEQPAQLSEEVMQAIESYAGSQEMGFIRRAALASLTRSMKQLMESATESRSSGEALADVSVRIKAYAEKLGELKSMMVAAAMRLEVALCNREDGLLLIRTAEQQVANG